MSKPDKNGNFIQDGVLMHDLVHREKKMTKREEIIKDTLVHWYASPNLTPEDSLGKVFDAAIKEIRDWMDRNAPFVRSCQDHTTVYYELSQFLDYLYQDLTAYQMEVARREMK